MFNNDERYWDIHKLNKWFAISSILFLVSMAWTFIDDNDDEFKIYQREFRKMEIEISEKNLQEELELVKTERLSFEKNLSEAEARLNTQLNKLDELEKVKATLPVAKWNAQWMQRPTSEEGAIIKREWWRKWDSDTIPPLQHVIQAYDTAYMKKETADFSAITTWGIFYPDQDSGANLILLDAVKGRYEFPELRRKALEQYKNWDPEMVIIEAKATGLPLTYELRQMDIPVVNFTPSKGNDKHVRVNSCAPVFESGMVWAPETKFAEEVIEECAAFPYGDHDDLVDSTTQAIMRFRQGGLINHPEDYRDERLPRRKYKYYW